MIYSKYLYFVAAEYVLVEFEDKSTSILQRNSECISTINSSDQNRCSVHWTDGDKYEATILFSGEGYGSYHV